MRLGYAINWPYGAETITISDCLIIATVASNVVDVNGTIACATRQNKRIAVDLSYRFDAFGIVTF